MGMPPPGPNRGFPPPPGPPSMGAPSMPQMPVAAPVAPPKLINKTKPELKLPVGLKLKAFTWKRVILDFEDGGQVASKDLKKPDPNWKGKTVLWKSIKELPVWLDGSKDISFETVQKLFPDKVVVAAKGDSGQISKIDKPKSFFGNSQNLFMIMSRLPKSGVFRTAVDNLNEKLVTEDHLSPLIKNWPGEEFEGLLEAAREEPEAKWEKVEQYFIELGQVKMFDKKIKVWLFKIKFDLTIKTLQN